MRQLTCHDSLQRIRAALARHGEEVSSRCSYAVMLKRVAKITGKAPTSISEEARMLNEFCEKNISADLPKVEFRPLMGYGKSMMAAKELAEMAR